MDNPRTSSLVATRSGGIIWKRGCKPRAAALDTPQHLVEALSNRKTEIIPLEFMAVASMLFTYGPILRGEDVMLFIDNKKKKRFLCISEGLQSVLGHPAPLHLLATRVPANGLPCLD